MNNKNKVIVIKILIIIIIIACGTYYYNSLKISLSKSSKNDNATTVDSDENNDTNKTEREEAVSYDTTNINEFIDNDEIVEVDLYVALRQYDDIKDKEAIMEIVKYLKSLKVEKVSQRPNSDTPEQIVSFTDNNEKKYSISFYDDVTALIKVDDEYLDEFYKFEEFNPEELRTICEDFGIENSF